MDKDRPENERNEKIEAVHNACDLLTELYDHAMSSELKNPFLNSITKPMKEKHKERIYASVIICGSLKENIKTCIEEELSQKIPEGFPVAGSTLFGSPLVWENSEEFGVKIIFEDGHSVVLEAADCK